MKILVINSGSSTLKYKLFSFSNSVEALYGQTLKHSGDFNKTFGEIFTCLKEKGFIQSVDEIAAYGHRVVHGAESFSDAVLVDKNVILQIEKLSSLAPLHNPANLKGIIKAKEISKGKPQVAVFDTSFHQTMSKSAYLYPIARENYTNYHIRRYGFHGTSHEYVANEAAKLLNKELNRCNLITVHLGNGASVCAIKEGKSVDTSMGFTPLEGLMMGTRCGDIDPSIIFELYKKGKSIAQIEKMCNLHSGLFSICGKSDFEAIEKMVKNKNQDAKLAVDMFSLRVKKYIGAYKELLEKVDAVVFTGGIGENSSLVRQKSINNVDESKNKVLEGKEIQKRYCEHKIYVIPTDEELLIAQKTKAFIS